MCKTGGSYSIYICVVSLFLVILGFGLGIIIDFFVIKQPEASGCFHDVHHDEGKNYTEMAIDYVDNVKGDGENDYEKFRGICERDCEVNYVLYKVGQLGLDSVKETAKKVSVQLCDESKLGLEDEEGRTTFEVKFDHLDPAECALSRNGTAKGQVLFINYGVKEDFELLRNYGVDVENKICIGRMGKVGVQAMVNNAQKVGAKALLFYSEKRTIYQSHLLASEDILQASVLAKVPFQRIKQEDAEKILTTLHGRRVEEWKFMFYAGPDFVRKFRGNTALLEVNTRFAAKKVSNAFIEIRGGLEPDRYIIIGSHRSDGDQTAPNIPTLNILKTAQILGHLKKAGWKPRRTIVLANFGMADFDYWGSKSWLHENWLEIFTRAVVYVNLDRSRRNISEMFLDHSLVDGVSQITGAFGKNFTDAFRPKEIFTTYLGVPAVDLNFGELTRKNGHFDALVVALVCQHFADAPIIPISPLNLANAFRDSFEVLKEHINELYSHGVHLDELNHASRHFQAVALKFSTTIASQNGGDSKNLLKQRQINDRLMQMGRCFVAATSKLNQAQTPAIEHLKSRNDFFSSITETLAEFENRTAESGEKLRKIVRRETERIICASKVFN